MKIIASSSFDITHERFPLTIYVGFVFAGFLIASIKLILIFASCYMQFFHWGRIGFDSYVDLTDFVADLVRTRREN